MKKDIMTEIVIGCTTDNNYVNQLKTTLHSLFINANVDTTFKIYLAYTSLTKKNISILKKFIDVYKHIIFFVRIPDKSLEGLHFKDYFVKDVYNRIFLFDLVKESKMIYLDSDLIILRDLTMLWETDLKPNIIGGVKEYLLDKNKLKRKSLSLAENDVYINAGVLLVDLKRWQDEAVTKNMIFMYDKHKEVITQADQDLINLYFKGNITELSAVYNMTPCLYYYNKYPWINHLYNTDFRHEIETAYIIHYTGELFRKPWSHTSIHPMRHIWRKYDVTWKDRYLTIQEIFLICKQYISLLPIPKSIRKYLYQRNNLK